MILKVILNFTYFEKVPKQHRFASISFFYLFYVGGIMPLKAI